MAAIPRNMRVYRSTYSLDQVIDTVTCTLGLERSEVLSRSRQRRLALARALITWYATERGVATLAEVARRLQRDPSTLFVAVERYRTLRPELFNLTALAGFRAVAAATADPGEQPDSRAPAGPCSPAQVRATGFPERALLRIASSVIAMSMDSCGDGPAHGAVSAAVFGAFDVLTRFANDSASAQKAVQRGRLEPLEIRVRPTPRFSSNSAGRSSGG